MPERAFLCLISVLLLSFGPQQETRESETVRYQEFGEIIEKIAKEVEKSPSEKPLVVWLIDNSSMLKSTKHDEMFSDAIARFFRKGKAWHAVVAFGERPRLVLKSTDDPARAAAAIAGLAAEPPDDAIKNCLLNVREAARYASGFTGKDNKFLVLFTQQNGDNEDDVEGTLGFLKKTGVTFFPISVEAVYSDPYWASVFNGTTYYFDTAPFRKLKFRLTGPESAFIEFPYGWPLSVVDPAYTAPSGFGYWALNRIATYTGGKYFLYNANRSTTSFCQRYACPVCSGDHRACGSIFDETKLDLAGPEIGSRREYLARYGKQPLYHANLKTWARLHKKSILRGPPPLKSSGGGLRENRGKGAAPYPLGGSDWRSIAGTVRRAAGEVESAVADLLACEEKFKLESDRRVLATTDALIVHLRMLACAYEQLAAFCDEMVRIRRGKAKPSSGFARDRLDVYIGKQIIGYSYRSVFLCHGGAALKNLRFLGDAETVRKLHETLDLADRMIDGHRGTPWETLMRRASVPVFTPIVQVAEGRKKRPPPPKSDSENETTKTQPTRPNRPDKGDQEGSGGTATGD